MKEKISILFLFASSCCYLFPSDLETCGHRKRERDEESRQIYAIPTYDAAFKWVLSDDTIRPSFFHAFVPDLKIVSSKRLDDHMNPLQDLQLLRSFLHSPDTKKTVESLTGRSELVVKKPGDKESHTEGTAFLHEIVGRFDDIKKAFPKVRYDGTMDFVCRLESNEYAMVEMQVIPQDHWDRRALAYVAAFYGNQLRKGQEWNDVKKVIGINILGGGRDRLAHWNDTPDQFVRHYKFQEQLHNHKMYIDGIELWQYSIMNTPATLKESEKEKQDWITFLKRGHDMSEEEVRGTITTKAVLDAFERARLDKLPSEVQEAYAAEDKEYERFSEYTRKKEEEGLVKGLAEGERKAKIETAKNLKSMGLSLDQIEKATGLLLEDLKTL